MCLQLLSSEEYGMSLKVGGLCAEKRPRFADSLLNAYSANLVPLVVAAAKHEINDSSQLLFAYTCHVFSCDANHFKSTGNSYFAEKA